MPPVEKFRYVGYRYVWAYVRAYVAHISQCFGGLSGS